LADTLTIIGAMVAFFIALHQYRKAQEWKRKEFILTFYSNALNNYNVKRGMRMLDWNRIDIPLQEGEIEGKNNFWFDDELLRSSLKNHFEMDASDGFSDEEAIVRLVMDEFFEKLGSCYPFIQAGLIKKEDVIEDIRYWIDIIGDENNQSKNTKTRTLLWKYLIVYKYGNTINLCKLFGYNISL
jgi:hypothetical protein